MFALASVSTGQRCTTVVAGFLDCDGERLPVCPTQAVIPYAVANAARLPASCLPEVMSGMEQDLVALKLHGVSDVHD